MIAPYGKIGDLSGYNQYLSYQLENYVVATNTSEYLIYFNVFFFALGNKSFPLLRMIDFIIQLSLEAYKLESMLSGLPYMHKNKNGTRKWIELFLGNEYPSQWMKYMSYSDGRLEFLHFVRVVICHKLNYRLSDKFVNFLIFSIFAELLPHLQLTLWTQLEFK